MFFGSMVLLDDLLLLSTVLEIQVQTGGVGVQLDNRYLVCPGLKLVRSEFNLTIDILYRVQVLLYLYHFLFVCDFSVMAISGFVWG